MPDEFSYDVFLSYSAKDKAVVRDVAERLRRDGVRVWFDEWVLKPGDSIPAKIEEGLERSRVLVLCMSAHAFGSDWAQLESGTLRFRDPLNKERRFLPLRLDDAPIKGSLAQFPIVELSAKDFEKSAARLIEAVRSEVTTLEPSEEGAETKLVEKDFKMMEVLEDLLHQLRSPILQAEFRAKRALEIAPESRESKELYAIKGLCAKASRVLRQWSVLAQLHMGKTPAIRSSPVLYESLIRLLIEIAADAELLFSPRRIRCQVERETFSVVNRIVLTTDLELLSVALNNLVDNAFKYSFADTQIAISGGMTRGGRFHISVTNKGIPFEPSEIKRSLLRGWRGSSAILVTSEGSGIGLWVTDKVMGALGGSLEIIPTTKDGETQVRLILPTTV